VAVAWGAVKVAVVQLVVVIKDMAHLVATQMHMMVEWTPTGTCNLRVLEVVFHLMVLLGIMHPVMGMVLPVMELVMAVMEVTVVLILAMEVQRLLPMETLMPQMLAMLVVRQVPLEVHGVLRPPLDMVLWDTGILLLGVFQVAVQVQAVAALVLHLLVNHLVQRLGMERKVMVMVGTVEVMRPMQIRLVMVLLEGVQGVSQITMLVAQVGSKVVVVAMLGVAMAIQMEIQVMEMLVGDLIHPRLQETMVVRQMVDKLVMVVGMAVLRHDNPNSSNFDGQLFQWEFHPVLWICNSLCTS